MSFNSKFLRALYKRLGITPTFSSAYHPQTDGQTERVNQTVEHFLRAYVSHQQTDWAKWLPLAEFSYNNAKHSATGKSPFFALYAREPIMSPTAVPAGSPEADDHASELIRVQEEIQSSLRLSKEKMAGLQPGDAPEYEIGDKVWLSSKNVTSDRPSKKLDHRRLGPFKILSEVSSHARKLELPLPLKRIHPVFHVSLLEPDHPNPFPLRLEPPPAPVLRGDSLEYEVQQVVDSKRAKRAGAKLHYYVQWKGYEGTGQEYSWEPVENLDNASELIQEFHQAYPDKPGPLGAPDDTPFYPSPHHF